MYTIIYHQEIRNDLAGIDRGYCRRLQEAINSKLVTDPIRFGKPLRQSLQGLRSLRVGDYRIVYLIKGDIVSVEIIAHRSVVYEKIIKRY